MPLPAPELDDRRFQDIVDEAKRLIPTYCPEWTNHNVADPGVALIELFAWMTELTLYRLNQLPTRLYLKFLDLVGVELLRPRAASTELTFWLSTASVPAVPVPKGTEVGTVRPDAARAVVFSTDSALSIVQPELSAFLVAGADEDLGSVVHRWAELRADGIEVACFPSDPPQAGESFLVGLAQPLPDHIVRFDVDCPTTGVGVRPAHPPLQWQVSTLDGWAPAEVWVDTTGGLNRAGSVELRLPASHAVTAVGGRRAAWVRVSALADEESYRGTPRLRSLSAVSLGAVVRAHHGRTVPGEALGISNGTSGQVFRVLHPPVLHRAEDEVVQVVGDDGVETWEAVADFARSGPDDRHCQWDDAAGEVRFGPAVRDRQGTVRRFGAVPPAGARITITGYRSGGGSEGNVGPGALRVLQRAVPHVDRVDNRHRAHGGSDGETVEQAMVRGPLELQHGERAVSAQDFEWFARRATASVARVRAVPPDAPGGNVDLLVVPHLAHRRHDAVVPADVAPLPPDVVEAITDELEPRRAMGTVVEVRPPDYVGVSVAALLDVSPGAGGPRVVHRALDALYRFLHPLHGGPEGDGWAFGVDVTASDLVRCLSAVDGVNRVADLALFRADPVQQRRLDRARHTVAIGPRELPLSMKHSVVVR